MAITVEKAANGYARFAKTYAQAVIAGMRAGILLAMKSAKYRYILDQGGPPIRRRLTSRSGALRDTVRMVEPKQKSGSFEGGLRAGGSGVAYAGIHEHGGYTHPTVTPRMRGFAWHRYRETGDSMWRAIAMTRKRKLTVPMPKRPYLRPALEENWSQVQRQVAVSLELLAAKGLR